MGSDAALMNAQIVLAIMGVGAGAVIAWLALVLFRSVSGRP